jgi:hypothetical protein
MPGPDDLDSFLETANNFTGVSFHSCDAPVQCPPVNDDLGFVVHEFVLSVQGWSIQIPL